jgi:DNA-binding XRE family transcriptional regulator
VIAVADPLAATPLAVVVLDDRCRSSDRIVARSSSPLANRRVVAGYTQEGLAEALGVDRTTVGRWERGAQRPHPWQRPDLARLLRITLEQLDCLLRTTQRHGADVVVSGALRDCPTACQR